MSSSVKLAFAVVFGLAPVSFDGVRAGGVPGTKEKITFEGVVAKHDQSLIGVYDGFGWGDIEAIGKGLYKDKQGFQSVVHGKVAAGNIDGPGIISRDDSSLFSFRSGTFASFGDGSVQATFKGWRQGVVVGMLVVDLPPAATQIVFDRTFSHIDQFTIEGITPVAFDDLHVMF